VAHNKLPDRRRVALRQSADGITPAGLHWQTPAVCLFLLLAVLAVFGQTAWFGFVNYDDELYVYENPVVAKGLSWNGALWALSFGHIGHWHPLTWLTHMADCQVYGLWPGGHHLTNVALHAATTVLLFLVLRAMTGALWRSGFVAAVFAVHPLRAESVAWVAERKDVLSGMFFMLTLWAYVKYVRQPSRGRYAAVAVWFALGLLSKNMLVTLPFLLLLLDWWPLGRMEGKHPPWLKLWRTGIAESAEQGNPGVPFLGLVKEKIPLFLLSIGSCVATVMVPEKLGGLDRVPAVERVGNALVSYVIYLRQMVCPTGLASPYPLAPHGPGIWKVCLAFAVLAAATAGTVACRKRRPYLAAGWLWFAGMLVPVIGIVQISYYAHADRYMYLPGIGLALAGTWAVGDWSAGWKHRRLILGGLMVAVIGVLMVCCQIQTSYWRDNETLWTRVLACTSGNSIAHNNMGNTLYAKGELDGAIRHYKESLKIDPDYTDARNNLGIALFAKGDKEGAIAQYRKALESRPDYFEAHYNLGIALFSTGESDQAIEQYRKGLASRPDYAAIRNNLGVALFGKADLDGAIEQYRKALESDPDYAEARNNLGYALFVKGDTEEAIAQYRKALANKPDYAKALNGLGNALARKGDLDQAIVCYRQALKNDPRFADAGANLGLAFSRKGETRQAMEAWQQTLEIKPDRVYVVNNLAWLLATTPDPTLRNGVKAVALAAQANQLSGGGDPMILHTLAAAYAEEASYGLATVTARRALDLATEQKNNALAATLQKEIKLYEADTPVRDITIKPGAPTARDATR
jgi:tetratricopeptide (TPR) repeat protein